MQSFWAVAIDLHSLICKCLYSTLKMLQEPAVTKDRSYHQAAE